MDTNEFTHTELSIIHTSLKWLKEKVLTGIIIDDKKMICLEFANQMFKAMNPDNVLTRHSEVTLFTNPKQTLQLIDDVLAKILNMKNIVELADSETV